MAALERMRGFATSAVGRDSEPGSPRSSDGLDSPGPVHEAGYALPDSPYAAVAAHVHDAALEREAAAAAAEAAAGRRRRDGGGVGFAPDVVLGPSGVATGEGEAAGEAEPLASGEETEEDRLGLGSRRHGPRRRGRSQAVSG